MSENSQKFEAGVIGDSITINAPIDKVWHIVTDLASIASRSSQCQKMIPLSLDLAVRPGVRTLNLNRRGKLWWPTTSIILSYDKPHVFSFKVVENGTIWKYTLESKAKKVVLTETRSTLSRSKIHAQIADKVLAIFGGKPAFDHEMQQGISETLQKIKESAESA